jgi:hypothetical protein
MNVVHSQIPNISHLYRKWDVLFNDAGDDNVLRTQRSPFLRIQADTDF